MSTAIIYDFITHLLNTILNAIKYTRSFLHILDYQEYKNVFFFRQVYTLHIYTRKKISLFI